MYRKSLSLEFIFSRVEVMKDVAIGAIIIKKSFDYNTTMQ